VTVPFKKDDLILFTGDSITDGTRNRECRFEDPAALGAGYVSILAGKLGFEQAGLNLRFRNTGISGDRSCDMLARWDADCIEIQPDWVSILVGVNNTWRRYDANDPTSDELFEAECRELLERVKSETSARMVLCSPFLLHTEESIVRMREDLDPKIGILEKLAGEYGAVWVDFDAAFVAATEQKPPAYWAFDGVHPTIAGHALMAGIWLEAVAGQASV